MSVFVKLNMRGLARMRLHLNSTRLAMVLMLMLMLMLIVDTALFASAALAAPGPDPLVGKVDAIYGHLNATGSPGIAIGVVRDGRVLLKRGYGLADVEHNIPINSSTVFDLASLAKQVTGLATAVLVTQGKVRLSDDVRRFIPELPDFRRTITIDQLLHHTSGIRDWPGTLYASGWSLDDIISQDQILTMAYNQRALNFAPGSEYLYSNTGFNLLAEVLRRVTGQTLAAWTKQNFFDRLGMQHTFFRTDHHALIANRAYGYEVRSRSTYGIIPDNLAAPGSSSLFSNIDDMTRWLISFDNGTAGGKEAFLLSQNRGRLKDGSPGAAAFGITPGSYKGLSMLTRSGEWGGVNSFFVYMPGKKFGVIAVSNNSAVSAQQAVIDVTNIYLADEFAATTGAAAPPPPPELLTRHGLLAGPSSPPEVNKLAGTYRLRSGSYLRVTAVEKARLAVQALGVPGWDESPLGEEPAELVWRKGLDFGLANSAAAVTFTRDAHGRGRAVRVDGREALRVSDEDGANEPRSLQEFAGRFESDELGTFYDVAVKADRLELRHRRLGRIPLHHLWGSTFASDSGLIGAVEFERDGRGHVSSMLMSVDVRSRDLRFTRQKTNRTGHQARRP